VEKSINLPNSAVLRVSDEANDAIRELIHDHIKAFNDDISEYHRTARVTGTRPLDLVVYDSGNAIIGALIADTYWGWLVIDDFWLEEAVRGKGLGRMLLNTAEQEAIVRDCRYSQLKTFSFQARGFYEKCGYQVAGELENYPPGHSLFWMVKELL